jgi:hypothetical protein
MLRGEVRHKNLWSVDLDTGVEQQITFFDVGFDIRDFDISPDGREMVIRTGPGLLGHCAARCAARVMSNLTPSCQISTTVWQLVRLAIRAAI